MEASCVPGGMQTDAEETVVDMKLTTYAVSLWGKNCGRKKSWQYEINNIGSFSVRCELRPKKQLTVWN